jgi:type III secretory pathway lipoprotein EscJ
MTGNREVLACPRSRHGVLYSDTKMRRFLAAIAPFVAPVALCTLAGCAVPVAAGLEEGDANRVVVALDQQGIDAAKEIDPTVEGRCRVTVPRDDASRALATMAGGPRPRA